MADQFGTLSPEDYAQQQQINRQQKMAEMLMSQNQQPQGQMVSGRYVAPSFFQYITPLVNAYVGKGLLEEGDTKQQALAEAIRSRGSQDLQEMLQTAKGTPAQQGGIYGQDGKRTQATTADMYNANLQLNPEYTQKEAIAGQAANPMAAILKGSNSYNPMARQYAGTLLAQVTKPPERFNLRENESRFVENPDGTATEIATGKAKEIKYPAQIELALALDRSLPRDPATWTQADADKANARIVKHIQSGAPNMTSINNVMAFEPFANKVQSKMGEGLVEQYSTLKNIPIEIANLNKAATLAPKSFAGTFAQQKTDAAKFFNNNFGTKIAVDKINNTEELGSRLFQSTMENLKKMDASPSQYQQKVMQQAFGTITTDPTSLPKIIEIQKEALTSKAKQHNLQVQQSQQGPAQLQFPYSITIPLEEVKNNAKLSPQDQEALAWANANPKDTRSADIKKRLGQ